MTALMNDVVDLSHRRRICLAFDPGVDIPIHVIGLPQEAPIATFITAFAVDLKARITDAKDDPAKLMRVFTTPALIEFGDIFYIVHLERQEADLERCGGYTLAAVPIGSAD